MDLLGNILMTMGIVGLVLLPGILSNLEGND